MLFNDGVDSYPETSDIFTRLHSHRRQFADRVGPGPSETPVITELTILRYIPEDGYLVEDFPWLSSER